MIVPKNRWFIKGSRALSSQEMNKKFIAIFIWASIKNRNSQQCRKGICLHQRENEWVGCFVHPSRGMYGPGQQGLWNPRSNLNVGIIYNLPSPGGMILNQKQKNKQASEW